MLTALNGRREGIWGGSSRRLILGVIQHMRWMSEENHGKLKIRIANPLAEMRTWDFSAVLISGREISLINEAQLNKSRSN